MLAPSTLMKSKIPLGLLCLGLLAITPARSEVIAFDSFQYPADESIVGLNGGHGFSGPWTLRNPGNGQVRATGDGIVITPTSGRLYASRSFDDLADGTYYFSWTTDNTNDGSRFMGLSLVSNNVEQTFIGQSNGQEKWGMQNLVPRSIGKRSARPSRPGIPPTRLVLKVELITGGVSNLSLIVDPDLDAAEPVADAVLPQTFENGINGLWLGAGYENEVAESADTTTTIPLINNVAITTKWKDLKTIK